MTTPPDHLTPRGTDSDILRMMDITADTDAWCDRLEDIDTGIGAFVGEPDRKHRIRATVAELSRRGSRTLYPLTVGVKDIMHVAGLPTTAGSALPAAELSGRQASVVTALRDAGAIVAGHTVTAEFAQTAPGGTRNPHDPGRTPGGSSSGSAAAVAAGAVPIAVGTQTIGSIIRPAAYCGVIGFKPSFGRVPTDGVIANSPSLDTVGFFAAELDLLRRVCAITVHDWHDVPDTDPVVAIPHGRYLGQAGPEATEMFGRQIQRLRDNGIRVREIPLFDEIAAINKAHHVINQFEFAYQHRQRYLRHGHLYRPESAAMVNTGQAISVTDYDRALRVREENSADFAAATRREKVDVWISPAATGPAPIGLANTGDARMNLPWTHVGVPALHLPAGTGPSNMPLGLQLTTASGGDEALLNWATTIASVLRS